MIEDLNNKTNIEVSISIISMNNLGVLIDCIDSIIKNTIGVSYEILVNAYKYSELNYSKLIKKYNSFDTIHIIRSNGIRGFSKNQNVLLKNANGKYCLILNDDTYFVDNSIKKLVDTFELYNNIDILSPIILNPDNTVQLNGRPKLTPIRYLRIILRVGTFYKSEYENKEGFYKTYNISGACFMIRNNVLKALNYFDERYFFCPEDIALSTKANKLGYSCYVDTKCTVFHENSTTTKKIRQATIPTKKQGIYIFFYDEYGKIIENFIRLVDLFVSGLKLIRWYLKKNSVKKYIMIEANKNVMRYSFKKINPKMLFIKLINDNKYR